MAKPPSPAARKGAQQRKVYEQMLADQNKAKEPKPK